MNITNIYLARAFSRLRQNHLKSNNHRMLVKLKVSEGLSNGKNNNRLLKTKAPRLLYRNQWSTIGERQKLSNNYLK